MIGTMAIALGMLAGAAPAGEAWPGASWEEAAPAEAGLDPARLDRVRDYALTGGGSGLIVRGGRRALAWGDPAATYDLKSSTKAMKRGTLKGASDRRHQRISSSSSGRSPSGTIQAFTSSSPNSDGAPVMITSRTAGCRVSAASTS